MKNTTKRILSFFKPNTSRLIYLAEFYILTRLLGGLINESWAEIDYISVLISKLLVYSLVAPYIIFYSIFGILFYILFLISIYVYSCLFDYLVRKLIKFEKEWMNILLSVSIFILINIWLFYILIGLSKLN